ncbi:MULTISPECIES: hypothetical protein [unclassified Rathayibacter]|uniref:hypothetical protein n=1 Tax=unclassified Rathayibacter TaxID=2609250 RepID=UPI0006F2DE73|nr:MULTISPECIES: hypothetical protein [unclassified Rathayibacter]KQQ03411.1 hypothetical protein ASF42_07760 [Rathayibacter sp. Leaf294]KQS11866.1 hypothetical protein ASG06_07760 [Rathayibacter sp. Leaf185]
MTTTHTPDATRQSYTARLRRELAVLPRRSRRDLLEHAAEHAADEPESTSSFGDPVAIARAALEQHDVGSRRPLRLSPLLPSKLLQIGAAVVTSPFALVALIDLLTTGSTLGLPRMALWMLIALPPLLARWTRWWRVSLVCTILQTCYLAAALVVTLGGGSVPSAGVVLLVTGPLAVAQVLALTLSVIALVRAPSVLRTV